MGNNIVETIIGAVVLVVAVFFVVFAYRTAEVAPTGGYELIAKFSRVDGLATGADVRVSGIKVGTVYDQKLDPETYDAVIRLSINEDVEMPDDTAVKVATDGLLGDTYLSLEPGGSPDMLENGDEIEFTQGSINVMDLVAQAIFGSAGKKTKSDDGAAGGAQD